MTTFGYGVPKEPQVRLTRPNDVNLLTNLDLQCYHYPFNIRDWQEFIKNVGEKSKIIILELGRTAIGFAAYELEEHSDGASFVAIAKLGVQPKFRRNGYGTLLLRNVERSASKLRADGISVLIPEYHCLPGDPDDVSQFFLANGFKPSGAIEYGYKKMYGNVIDGFYFVKKLI